MSESNSSLSRFRPSFLGGADASPNDAEKLVAGYNEPAALIARDGHTVLAANRHTQRIAHVFENGPNSELVHLAEVARSGGQLVSATVMIAVATGQVVYHVTVVPGVLSNATLFLFHDQTLDHNLREALIESRQRYKDLVEVSSDFSWEVDADGHFQFVSRTGALGFEPEDLVGKRPEDLVVGAEEFDPLPFLADKVVEDVELWMRTKSGGMACLVVSAMPFFEDDGALVGVRGVCRDVTAERERAAALAQAHQREQILGYIVNTIREEIEPSDMLASAAAATARALGAQGANILRLIPAHPDEPEDAAKAFDTAAQYGSGGPGQLDDEFLDFRDSSRDLRERDIEGWFVLAAPCVYAGELNGVITLWRRDDWHDDARLLLGDIANQLGIAIAQIANHESIVRLSRTDAMTGLLNRRAFYDEELPRRFKRLAHEGMTGALFYVDMDNFKLVNDVHGHQVGDDAILALREVLHDFVRPGDLIARLGGDEFALWLDGVDGETALHRAQDLLKASIPLQKFSGAEDRPLGISVGIAVFDPSSGETLESLLARADGAMYTVKQNAKGGAELAPNYPGGDAA